MPSPLIEETLSAASATTEGISGAYLGRGQTHEYAGVGITAGVIQCIRVQDTGDYEVIFEGGIVKNDGTVGAWSEVATITQANDSEIRTFTLAPGCQYRFRRAATSAAAVTILCLLN